MLGAGYVGRALLARFPCADATHRQSSGDPRTHVFRLDEPETWSNPPLDGRAIVWTFPARPIELVQQFHGAALQATSNLIVLGSTSAYAIPSPQAEGAGIVTVSECSPLDMEQPRVAGEEWLRMQGATILQLAGIVGPGREPEAWLRAGRIRDGAKLVNLIHVDDIVKVIAHLLAHPLPGQRINVGNGEPVVWRTLAASLKRQGRLPTDHVLASSGPEAHGKRVDTRKLQSLLPDQRFRAP